MQMQGDLWWYRLKANFYDQPSVKAVRESLPRHEGDSVLVFYQIVTTRTLNTQGKIIPRSGKDVFNELHFMTGFPYKKCQLFAKILAENRLFVMMEDGSIEVPEVPLNTGHETKWASYKRQKRELDKVQRDREEKEKEIEIEGEKREKRTISKNSFNNFQQRNDYNFEKFEKLQQSDWDSLRSMMSDSEQEEKNDQQEAEETSLRKTVDSEQEEKSDQQEIKDLLETSAHQIDRESSVNQLVDRLRSSKFEE